MHYPTDRITHTTSFVTPVVEHWLEREIAYTEQERSHKQKMDWERNFSSDSHYDEFANEMPFVGDTLHPFQLEPVFTAGTSALSLTGSYITGLDD